MPIKPNVGFKLCKPARVPNYYATLGVIRTASFVQIRQAYLALARANHPDVGGDTDKMAGIAVAYAILHDPRARKDYDAKLRMLTSVCATCKGTGATYKQSGFTRRVTAPCPVCGGSGVRERR